MNKILFVAAIAALVALAVLAEASVWTECRTDHSFLYCFRVLSR